MLVWSDEYMCGILGPHTASTSFQEKSVTNFAHRMKKSISRPRHSSQIRAYLSSSTLLSIELGRDCHAVASRPRSPPDAAERRRRTDVPARTSGPGPFDDAQQLMKESRETNLPDFAPDMLAKPRRARRLAVAPDAAPPPSSIGYGKYQLQQWRQAEAAARNRLLAGKPLRQTVLSSLLRRERGLRLDRGEGLCGFRR